MKQYPILIGRNGAEYLKFEGTESVALHARSGSGKTANFGIPNAFNWPGSLVVLDIKGSIFKATAGHRATRLHQDVYLFNPTALDGRSHKWNMFDAIDRTGIDRFDQIIRQAYALVPESLGSSNAERFWEPAGRQAFISVAAFIAETPEEPLTLSNILRVFMRGDYQEWLTNHIERRRIQKRPYSALVVEGISDFLSGNQDMVASLRKTISATLAGFWNPRVTAATDTSDFNLHDLRRRPMTIYVTVAPAHMPRMRPLLRLLFDQIINWNTDLTPDEDPSLKVPVLLLLDEFVQLGKAVTLAHSGQYVREYGIRIAYVIQDKPQLTELYGNAAARDIFSNLGVEIVFGTSDIDLAGEIEKRLGDDTMMSDTINKPRWMPSFNLSRQSVAQSPHRRPVMLDHEILQMPPNQQIILRPGMPGAVTERIVWYEDANFRKLQLPPPEIPLLDIKIREDDGSVQLPRRRATQPS